MPQPSSTPPYRKYSVQSYTIISPVIPLSKFEDEEVSSSFFLFQIPTSNIGLQFFDLDKNDFYNITIASVKTDVFRTPFGISGRNLIGRFPFCNAVWIYGHYDCVNKNRRQKNIVFDYFRINRFLFSLPFFNAIKHCGQRDQKKTLRN